MPVQNYFKKNVIDYLIRSLNKINEPKDLLISDSFVNWKILFPQKARYRVTPTIRRTPLTQHSQFACKLIPRDGNAPGFDVKSLDYDAST